jgi:hypothetical protein
MHYRISEPKDPAASDVFSATMKMLAEDKDMQADRKRFSEYCCAPNAPVMIVGRARGEKVTA